MSQLANMNAHQSGISNLVCSPLVTFCSFDRYCRIFTFGCTECWRL